MNHLLTNILTIISYLILLFYLTVSITKFRFIYH